MIQEGLPSVTTYCKGDRGATTSVPLPVCSEASEELVLQYLRCQMRIRFPSWQELGFSYPCRWGSRLLQRLAKSLWGCRALSLMKKPVKWAARAVWQGSCWWPGPEEAGAERACKTLSGAQWAGSVDQAWLEPGGSQETGEGAVGCEGRRLVKDQAGDQELRWPQTWKQRENLDSEEVLCPDRKF